jgi:hypothetical protein
MWIVPVLLLMIAPALVATQTQMVEAPDRANIAAAQPYDNPRLECKESLPTIKPWSKGKFLDRSDSNGSELIQFANGDKYWFKVGDIYPLYRVKGTQPVEIKNYRMGHDDEGKLRWEIKSLVPPLFLKPGELVALDPTPLQLMGLYRFYTEDGRSGVVSLWDIVPQGDGGGIREL